MLHISRVEIVNYRNFRHLVLDPFPERAVIVGENGVGKSNFLRALRLVLDPSLPDSLRMLEPEDLWAGVDDRQSAEIVVDVELQGFDDDVNAAVVLDACITRNNPRVAKLTYRWRAIETEEAQSDSSEASPDSATRNESEIPISRPQMRYRWTVYGGGDEANDVSRVRRDIALRVLDALRDAESDLQSWRRNPIRELLNRVTLEADGQSAIEASLSDAAESLREDPSIEALQKRLRRRLSSMAGPTFPITPTLGFHASGTEDLLRSVELFIDETMTRGVGRTSLGGSNVLYLALLLEQFVQRREAEEFAAYILGVEEPEAHLHVTLQRKLFRWLLREEQSIILTTHSPHIAAVAPLSSIVRFRQEGDETTAHTAVHAGMDEKQAADVERYLDVSRAEILFAKAIILVEGTAEQFLIPVIAKILQIDLDELGIAVASVQGTDFLPYVRFLGAAGVATPLVVLTDGDEPLSGMKLPGLQRGVELVEESSRGSLLALLQDALAAPMPAASPGAAAVRAGLAARNIFVGTNTLEMDIRGAFAGELISAFNYFVQGKVRRERFATELSARGATVADRKLQGSYLGRIEAIGKGRFAQRLAGEIKPELFDAVATGDVPEGISYLVEAIRAAKRLVER